MKHTYRKTALLLAALTAVSAPALAAGDKGFYVQGDLGVSRVKADAKVLEFKKTGFTPRIGAGYDFGTIRVAADYTHYQNMSAHHQNGLNAEVKAKSAGISVVYDMPVSDNFELYMGSRLAMNNIKMDASRAGDRAASDETKFGSGFLAGGAYQFNENLTLDVGYRFNRLAADFNAHEVSAGLRYKF